MAIKFIYYHRQAVNLFYGFIFIFILNSYQNRKLSKLIN